MAGRLQDKSAYQHVWDSRALPVHWSTPLLAQPLHPHWCLTEWPTFLTLAQWTGLCGRKAPGQVCVPARLGWFISSSVLANSAAGSTFAPTLVSDRVAHLLDSLAQWSRLCGREAPGQVCLPARLGQLNSSDASVNFAVCSTFAPTLVPDRVAHILGMVELFRCIGQLCFWVNLCITHSHPISPNLMQRNAISSNPVHSHPISSNLAQSHPTPSNPNQSHPISPSPIHSHPACVQPSGKVPPACS